MEFKTESGAEVVINMADFIDASRLRVAVLGAIKESGVEISKVDIEKLLSGVKEDMGAAVKSGALDSLLDMVISLDCSEKVNNEIFNCLKRSTYNSEKITRDTFNELEARGDYYHIVIMCLKVNLAPFFKTLFSKLSALQLMKKQESQK
jgi:hypothetical protein